MNNNLIFRTGKKEDKERIYELMVIGMQNDPLAFRNEWVEFVAMDKMRKDSYVLNYLAHGKNRMFLCFDGELLVGMVGLNFNWQERKKHTADIYWMYVRKSYRGKGIAKRLMQELLDYAATFDDLLKLKLTVNAKQEAAKKIYTSFGFEQSGIEKSELLIEGEYIDVILMEKFLQ